MLSEAGRLVPYALLAALSPLGFAATIAVMRAGRLRALGFAVGVVIGQLFACAALVLLGGVSIPSHTSGHPTLEGVLGLAFGLLLLGYAVILHRRPADLTGTPAASGRSKEILGRLGRVRAFTAAVAGLLLGIGGPKRLVLTALASASIAAAGATGSDGTALVFWYSGLATVLVWLPVLGYLVLGQWAVTRLDLGLEWLTRHRRPATVSVLGLLGLVLVIDSAALL